jgi:hypothetical protein
VSYDVEGPDPVPTRSLGRPLRTVIVLGLLAVAVLVAGRWGWAQLTQPFGDVSAAATPTAEASPTCTPAGKPQQDALPAPSTITVNVYNAGRVQGLAANAAGQLEAQDFIIGAVDNDPLGKQLAGVGEIRSAAGPQARPKVEQLLRYVPGATWVQDGRTDGTLDFAAGAGFTTVTEPKPAAKPKPDKDDIPTC